MGLEELLLGRLGVPATGYDLKAWLDREGGHLWPAELSQIYPTLARLEDRGLLESHREASRRGPPRRVYVLTEAGRQELLDRVADPAPPGRERSPHRTRLHLLDAVGDPALAAEVVARLDGHLGERVARLEGVVTRLEAGPLPRGHARAAAVMALAAARAERDALREALGPPAP